MHVPKHMFTALFFFQNTSLAKLPTLFVTHDGIFDVSSLLNAAPCQTGAAAARVLRHRASVDVAACHSRAQLVWGQPKLTGAHNSAGKRHSNADELRLKHARSWNSTGWTWIECALFGNRTALQGFGSLPRKRSAATTGSTLSSVPEC